MNTVKYKRKALKQMKRIPNNYLLAIMDAISSLKDYPNVEGLSFKALKDHKYGYRLRVNRYRVMFDIEQKATKDGDIYYIIHIQEVKKRDEQTY